MSRPTLSLAPDENAELTGSAASPATEGSDRLVLYDGVCGLCNRAVQFILRRDGRGRFRYMPLQSEAAGAILKRHGLAADRSTFVLVAHPGTPHERVFTRSRGALAVARSLGGLWRLLAAVAWWMPRPLLDVAYDQVAQRRYAWFGKADACLLPSPEQRARFLGLD